MSRRGSIRDFKSQLAASDKHGSLHVFIYGSCDYLMTAALRRFKELCARAGVDASCSLEAAAVSEEQWAALMEQPAMFEPATLYVLKRCEQTKQLPKLVQRMTTAGNAVNRAGFLYGGEPPVALKNALAKAGIPTVACLEPWPNEVPPLVREIAADLGVHLANDAVEALLAANGVDLGKLENELRRLSLVLHSASGSITANDLASHLGMLREDDAFELVNLLLARQWSKAQALATSLLERGESALALIGIIANHCRNATRIAAGAPASQIRLPPTIYRAYAKACQGQSPRRFAQGLEKCQQVELQLKSSRMSEELLLGSLIESLA